MKAKCDKCKHVWDYKGKSVRPCCPSCQRKLKKSIVTAEDLFTKADKLPVDKKVKKNVKNKT